MVEAKHHEQNEEEKSDPKDALSRISSQRERKRPTSLREAPVVIHRQQHHVPGAEFAFSDDTVVYMGSLPPANSGDSLVQRRSQRVMLKVSVVVLAQGPGNKMISEETRTVTVNAHGAMILLTAKVSVGQLLTLRNQRSAEEVLCRVAYVNPHLGEKKEVGVDFTKPCPNFWRISFPPADWTTRSPEAKGSTKQRK